jgi:hypothetical protein
MTKTQGNNGSGSSNKAQMTSTTSANLRRCGPPASRRAFTKASKIENDEKRKKLSESGNDKK